MSSSYSPIRAPFILAAALAFHLSMTPPGEYDTREENKAISSSAHFIVSALTKGIYWATTLSELSTYVPLPLPKAIPTSFSDLPCPCPYVTALHDHLPLIAGTTLAITGALLRRTAQRTLGRFYCARSRPYPRPGHALITNGPYAFVRHPGYAGLAMCTLGVLLVHVDTHTALGLGALRWSSTLGDTSMGALKPAVWIALAGAIIGTLGAVRRIGKEEEVLQETFKTQWEAYTVNVKYRMVPGVY